MALIVNILETVTTTILSDSDYVFNKDAKVIVDTLSSIGIKWIDCKIELINKSSSNVYQITVGDGYKICCSDKVFTMKVNRSRSRFKQEVDAIAKIVNYSISLRSGNNNINNNFYAIGYSSYDSSNSNNTVYLFDKERDKDFFREKFNDKVENKNNNWYSNGVFDKSVVPKDDSFTGIIMMHKGYNLHSNILL